jgi:UDP-N-acetylmuramoylalanine--D-glutamate ligase
MEKNKPESTLLPFSQKEEVFPGAYIKNNELIIGINTKNEFTMNMEELSLKGKHNRYNTMASAIAARILEVRKDVTREALRSFQSIDHRLETIAIIRDVQYVNDSKATNVNSVWFALESFNQPIVWIAGGEDKGNDYSEIKALVKERVKALICLGIDNTKLHEEFAADVSSITDAGSMQEAIKKAVALAEPGDVVLLSPACASFDLFENYEKF